MAGSKHLKSAETVQSFSHRQNQYPDICCGVVRDFVFYTRLSKHGHVDVHLDPELRHFAHSASRIAVAVANIIWQWLCHKYR